ncbi:MAG: hypothetical protein ACOVSW_09080 [Candidatus Kapaibacteriota bacterium]
MTTKEPAGRSRKPPDGETRSISCSLAHTLHEAHHLATSSSPDQDDT